MGLTVFPYVNLLSTNQLSCILMKNKKCKVRPKIINVNSDETIFYPFSIKTSKCSGSCNNINDTCGKVCVPDVVKKLNVKVFNLMLETNEARHIKWHETCKCKCRLECRNDGKCRCEGVCNEGFIWKPSNCECDKSCDVGEYLG